MSTLPQQNTREFIPIGEAARILGISIVTIRRWCQKGTLVEYRDGSNVRNFRRSDIERLAIERLPRLRGGEHG